MALPKAQEIVSSNPVVVFRSHSFLSDSIICIFNSLNLIRFWNNSKSYCPFCVTVKKLLSELGATFKAIELDTESNFFIFPFLYPFPILLSFLFLWFSNYITIVMSFTFSWFLTGKWICSHHVWENCCVPTCPKWVRFCYQICFSTEIQLMLWPLGQEIF